jgi:hypothetical protein
MTLSFPSIISAVKMRPESGADCLQKASANDTAGGRAAGHSKPKRKSPIALDGSKFDLPSLCCSRKVTKKLEQLERLKKEQRRVELAPDDLAQGSDSEGERPGPVPGVRNKESDREKGRIGKTEQQAHQARRECPPASGQKNPRSSGTEKGKGAETSKGVERRDAEGLVGKSDAELPARNGEAGRADRANGVKTPNSSAQMQMKSLSGAEKSRQGAGSVPGAVLRSEGTTAVRKGASGVEKWLREGGSGSKTSKELRSPKGTNGLLDRWLEKGPEGQPKKKPRLEGALHAGCGHVQERGVGGGSSEGRRNEASASVQGSGAAASGGGRSGVLRRPRVIMESEESEEEEPIVIKRRRVECEGDGRGGALGRGEKDGAEEGDIREGIGAERDRSGERDGVGAVMERDRLGEKKSAEGVGTRTGEKSATEADRRGKGQRTREEGGKDEQGVFSGSKPTASVHVNTEQARIAKSAAVPSQAAKSGVTEQSKSGTMKAVPGKNQPGQPPAKKALKEITNERPGTQPSSNRGKSKEVPRGTSHMTCLEDLVETQRVDPLTQMGDSEDPEGEDDIAKIPPENPVGSRATPQEPLSRSRESWERSTGEEAGARNLKGPVGGQVDGNSPANGALGGGARPSGSLGGRPVDLNEQSSAGPATLGGRKSQASGRETTSGNTGSFRGSQVRDLDHGKAFCIGGNLQRTDVCPLVNQGAH